MRPWKGLPAEYVTGTSFYTPNCDLGAYINVREVIAYSTNQGATWSAPVTPQRRFARPGPVH